MPFELELLGAAGAAWQTTSRSAATTAAQMFCEDVCGEGARASALERGAQSVLVQIGTDLGTGALRTCRRFRARGGVARRRYRSTRTTRFLTHHCQRDHIRVHRVREIRSRLADSGPERPTRVRHRRCIGVNHSLGRAAQSVAARRTRRFDVASRGSHAPFVYMDEQHEDIRIENKHRGTAAGVAPLLLTIPQAAACSRSDARPSTSSSAPASSKPCTSAARSVSRSMRSGRSSTGSGCRSDRLPSPNALSASSPSRPFPVHNAAQPRRSRRR